MRTPQRAASRTSLGFHIAESSTRRMVTPPTEAWYPSQHAAASRAVTERRTAAPSAARERRSGRVDMGMVVQTHGRGGAFHGAVKPAPPAGRRDEHRAERVARGEVGDRHRVAEVGRSKLWARPARRYGI